MSEQDRLSVFIGSSSSRAKGSALNYSFTTHAGGSFDPSCMDRLGHFEVAYIGPDKALTLVMISHSGGPRWCPVPADSCTFLPDQTRLALFSLDSVLRCCGDELSRLDEIRAVSCTDEETVLRRIRFVPGNGTPLSLSAGRWTAPDTGIAFIGDSIVQNVLYNEGDFNALLGRSDCVNFGIGAQTTVHCLNRIGEIAGRRFRQLAVWCGVNDIGSTDTAQDIAGRIQKMIDICRNENPGMRFIIISILPTSCSWYVDQSKLLTVNELNEAYASGAKDTVFLNVHSDFASEDGYGKPELYLDGLHPNHGGYLILKRRLLPLLI